MSSISRARSSASAQAAAGVWATSGVPLAPWSSGEVAHVGHQLREQQPAFEAAKRRRQGERVGGDVAGRGFGKRDLVLVDIADRDDARQDRGVALWRVEKRIAHQPAGAARRQIKRRRRKRERIAATAKPSLPPVNALISVGRNGADAGMVKTRGSHGVIYSIFDRVTFRGGG